MIHTAHRAGRRSCLPFSIAPVCSLLLAVEAFGGSGAWWNDAAFYEVFVRSSRNPGASRTEDPGDVGDLTLRVESTEAFRPPHLQTSSWRCCP
jgi:hypothetical protein